MENEEKYLAVDMNKTFEHSANDALMQVVTQFISPPPSPQNQGGK